MLMLFSVFVVLHTGLLQFQQSGGKSSFGAHSKALRYGTNQAECACLRAEGVSPGQFIISHARKCASVHGML